MADDKKDPNVPAETAAETPVDKQENFEAEAPKEDHFEEPAQPTGTLLLPAGWIYKTYRIMGKDYWYASPQIQLLMISFVCFLCPGMFNSLVGMGGGGLSREYHAVQDNNSVALYSTFAIVGFFAGTVTNRLGLRPALAIGGAGYCIYSASFLCFKHTHNKGFVIASGAILGICAGLLWCAQGAIMMAYPPENKKGRYISIFWIIFNLGGAVGSLISLAQIVNNKASDTASDGTYISFIILMFIGAMISLLLTNADKVIRQDGSKVILMKNPSWSSEIMGIWYTITEQPYVLLLFPMFFCSNAFYTYQNNGLNGAHFNARTRALNSLLYWLAQILGAVVNGWALDYTKMRRSTRARISYVALLSLTFIIWGGGWAWQKNQVTRKYMDEHPEASGNLDWADHSSKSLGPLFLYFFYGFYDAFWQTSIYWYMGALSNSGRKAANMAGFYKGVQSAGAAIFWRLDALKVEYNTLFGATWGMIGGALVIAAPVILLKIQDHVSVEEDLKFSDETIEDVTVTKLDKKEHYDDA